MASLLLLLACSNRPTPKDVVFDFIDAVLTSDSLRVVKDLDLDAYIKLRMTSMTPQDSAAALSEYRIKTISSLLDDGAVRTNWLDSQIVVNKESRQDSTAEVEVSFIDRSIGHQLYTKMQLRQQADGSWRITYFR